ncbi:MAG: NAD(P)-dependent oxidoreductase [Bacteroidia bacterium]|nr:NAD(P)-dependent oxidoreductase [Bacteroidia bacterium]
MKVLVTGATGGLGSLVVENLLLSGHTVIATSRNAEKAAQCSFYSKVTYKAFDISAPISTNLYEYYGQPDLLIHLAWEKLNEYKNEAHLGEILTQHKLFLDNLLQNGLKDLTVVGTCYEYGLQEGELEESMTTMPTMPYPQAKNLLRQHLEELNHKIYFNLKWIRVFYVFGEIKERKNLYTLLLAAIKNGDKTFNMSGGEQTRDFLSPAQIAGIIGKTALQNKVLGIVNCCSGKPVVLKEFIRHFLEINNYSIQLNLGHYPYPDYEPMHTWGSAKKLNGIIEAV